MTATTTRRRVAFAPEEIRGIRDGRKTQFRRIVEASVPHDAHEVFLWPDCQPMPHHSRPGIWARRRHTIDTVEESSGDGWIKRLGKNPYGWPDGRIAVEGVPGLSLVIVNILFERLHDVTLADAADEGAPPTHEADNVWDSIETYRLMWNRLNGPRAWLKNPWTAVVRFNVAK